jgi:hypothetical protein
MGKTGLFHITGKRATDNLGIQLPDGRRVEAIEAQEETIRWLEVLLDRKMTFKAHVKESCCRASKVRIKILAGCYKGAPTDSLLMAVRACVLPILTYGYHSTRISKCQYAAHFAGENKQKLTFLTLS